MIFNFFLTAGHLLSHSTLVADQDFLTAEAKNVADSSRNFQVRSKTFCRNSNVFFLYFLVGEGQGQMLSSLSLFCLSLFYSLIDPSMGSHQTDCRKTPGVYPSRIFFLFDQSQLVPTCCRKTPGISYSRILLVKEISPLLSIHIISHRIDPMEEFKGLIGRQTDPDLLQNYQKEAVYTLWIC